MNDLGLTSILILTLGALAVGCDPGDKCIADCDSAGATDTGSSSDDGSQTDEGGDNTSAANSCESNTAAVQAFVEANRQCVTALDCIAVDSICYQGSLNGPCGSLALSTDADIDAWNDLYGELGVCECGANPCGSVTTCDDEGQCEEVLGDGIVCERNERDIDTFLANNRACETDADCVLVPAECHFGPERACAEIGLNTSADLGDWATLHASLDSCVEDCPAEECGASVSCGPEGLCMAVFP